MYFKLRFYFNFEIRSSLDRPNKLDNGYSKSEEYYDLYKLSNNTMFGQEHIVMYSYSLDDFFKTAKPEDKDKYIFLFKIRNNIFL